MSIQIAVLYALLVCVFSSKKTVVLLKDRKQCFNNSRIFVTQADLMYALMQALNTSKLNFMSDSLRREIPKQGEGYYTACAVVNQL